MNQYRHNRRQSFQKNKDNVSKQSPTKQKTKISRFPQTRLFALILRKIYHRKIGSIFDLIKTKQRPRYKYLNVIDNMINTRIQQSFTHIVMYSKSVALSYTKKQVGKVNIKIFLIKSLERLYNKTLKIGFNGINTFNIVNNNHLSQISICFENTFQTFNKSLKIYSWRRILKFSSRGTLQKINMLLLSKNCIKILNKNLKIAFNSIHIKYSQVFYQNLYTQSQTKRKLAYQYETNKRQFLINQRQALHNLKQIIDNFAYQRNVKLGQLKRDKAIKISQTTQKIRQLQRQLSQSQIQTNKIQRNLIKSNLLVQKRKKLQNKSQGALIKVHNLFNQLKYQNQQKIQSPKASSFLKIILNKQKLKKYLTQYDKIKSQVQQFQISNNIILRNMICIYENVSIQSIKLSQQYILATQQNNSLKQSLNSLLSYHLLKDQGDYKLKQNNNQLEIYFQRLFGYLGEQRQKYRQGQGQRYGEDNMEIRDSFISIQSLKSLKKKSSLKTSVFSTKSIK